MSKKLSTTTITGTPPQWDDAEYNRRLEIQLHCYHNTAQSREIVVAPLEHDWLDLVIAKLADGYTVCKKYPISHDQLHHQLYMKKPVDQQTVDITDIKEQVKVEYVSWLQAELVEYKAKLTQQLLEAKIAKERQAQEAKDAKRLADAQREADECFGELVIPDGIPEVKPAEFNLEME